MLVNDLHARLTPTRVPRVVAPRTKLRRRVELGTTEGLMQAFERRRAAGFRYGEFQFAIDPRDEGFLKHGIFSCYEPVPDDTPLPRGRRELSLDDWRLAHVAKGEAFDRYTEHYVASDGQVYWSDLAQLSPYLDDYHEAIDPLLGPRPRGTELIGELCVPRNALEPFLADAREP